MFERDLALYDRAAVIPGRSLTRSKAPGRFGPLGEVPLYCTHGQGPYLFTQDGRAYIDMLCGLGAISLGYQDTAHSGGVYSLPHWLEVEAAELVLAHVSPWASSVRFTKTGSEATQAAYLVACQATGRRGVWMGDWAYHGWHSWVTDAHRFAHGADPRDVLRQVRPTSWWAWLKRLFGRLEPPAAVFIEPHRWEPVNREWLADVRAFCDHIGALLVFDSMIYGGRMALGGATEYFGIRPDLECFGKAFGNGQSVAFVVGRDALQAHGELVSGTYSGDTVGLSAVCSTIQTYVKADVVATLWARGRQLMEGLEALGVPVEGLPVHQRIVFRDKAHGLAFGAEMVKRGVLWHPDVTNIMAAHTAEIIDRVVVAAGESWQAVL